MNCWQPKCLEEVQRQQAGKHYLKRPEIFCSQHFTHILGYFHILRKYNNLNHISKSGCCSKNASIDSSCPFRLFAPLHGRTRVWKWENICSPSLTAVIKRHLSQRRRLTAHISTVVPPAEQGNNTARLWWLFSHTDGVKMTCFSEGKTLLFRK